MSTFTTINLTTGNPGLARISAMKNPNKWVNLGLRNLPADLKADLVAVLTAIKGEELSAEYLETLSVCSINFENGSFKAAYPPSLHVKDDQLVVKFGRENIALNNLSEAGFELTFELFKLAQYENPTFVLILTQEDGHEITFPIPLRLNKDGYELAKEDDKALVRRLNSSLKKNDFSYLKSLLVEATDGEGGVPAIDVKTLPEDTDFPVVAVKEVSASYGKTYIVTILVNEVETNIWATSQVRELMSLGALLTPTTTFSYSTYQNKTGMTIVRGTFENIDFIKQRTDFDLDDLM